MPSFRYRALTQAGEMVSGSISATSAAEVVRQVEYLGLVPIEAVSDGGGAGGWNLSLAFFNKPRLEDVTIFTRDLALLLKAGARIDAALELLSSDTWTLGGSVQSSAKYARAFLAAKAWRKRSAIIPRLFPMFMWLWCVSARPRERLTTFSKFWRPSVNAGRHCDESSARQCDILPSFCSPQAACLRSFCCSSCPSSRSVLRGFQTKLDPIVGFFLGLSDLVRSHGTAIAVCAVILVVSGWLLAGPSRCAAGCMEHHDAPSHFEIALDVSHDGAILPQPRTPARQRHDIVRDVADPRRSAGSPGPAGGVDPSGRSRSAWRQAFRCAGRCQGSSRYSSAHVKDRGGDGTACDLEQPHRGVLRGKATAQLGSE